MLEARRERADDLTSTLTEMLLNRSPKKDEKLQSYSKQYDPSLGKLMGLISTQKQTAEQIDAETRHANLKASIDKSIIKNLMLKLEKNNSSP